MMDDLYFRTTLDHGVCEIKIPRIVTGHDIDDLAIIWEMV